MNFSPLFTSTWDSSLLDGMLHELRAVQGDLPDESMAEEDFNVGEETINVRDTEVEKTIDVCLFSSFEYPWPRQLKLPKPVSLKGSHKGHYPRKSLSWTVSIPLGEHRNIDLFSQSVLEQTHEG